MESVLQLLPPGARILVVRLRSLGDCVLTTPALEILKRARPDVEVLVVVEKRFEAVFAGNPDVSAVMSADIGQVAAARAALCLDLHGGTRGALLTLASRARVRAGSGHFRHRWAYNLRIPRAQQILGEERPVHTAEHLASTIFHLGAARTEIPRARLFAEPARSTRPYAVLHPFASSPGKTWPGENFLEVARHLDAACGLDPVFIGGPSDDLSFASPHRRIAGASLDEVKSLLAGASLFIGNDSGPAHMAAAFGLPVLVLFGDSDPVVWAPWKTIAEKIVARTSIGDIPVSAVVQALERLRVAA